jgi:hypothetical protein
MALVAHCLEIEGVIKMTVGEYWISLGSVYIDTVYTVWLLIRFQFIPRVSHDSLTEAAGIR